MKIDNIKFKAKRLDGKGWVEGYFYKECGNTYIIEDRQSESSLNRNIPHCIPHLVNPSTVCQFTGLKDENGGEIWEHDILASPWQRGEVVSDECCSFCVKSDYGSSFSFLELFRTDDKIDCCAVVGNKFDKKGGEK